jgi:hypothetical protein
MATRFSQSLLKNSGYAFLASAIMFCGFAFVADAIGWPYVVSGLFFVPPMFYLAIVSIRQNSRMLWIGSYISITLLQTLFSANLLPEWFGGGSADFMLQLLLVQAGLFGSLYALRKSVSRERHA